MLGFGFGFGFGFGLGSGLTGMAMEVFEELELLLLLLLLGGDLGGAGKSPGIGLGSSGSLQGGVTSIRCWSRSSAWIAAARVVRTVCTRWMSCECEEATVV